MRPVEPSTSSPDRSRGDLETDAGSEPRSYPTGARIMAWLLVGLFAGAVVAVAAASFFGNDSTPSGEAGALADTVWPMPDDIDLPVLADATAAWGLDSTVRSDVDDALAGGSTIADLDADSDPDLVVAHGAVRIFRWDGEGYLAPIVVDIGSAVAVSAADVDADGWIDLLIARDAADDTIVWGGEWTTDGSRPELTELAGANPSSALLAGELSGDERIDIVRLGRGQDQGEPDILWIALGDRRFGTTELPSGDRLSLAGEVVDIDADGLLDVWVTRDVGWINGGDSIYSRRGDPTGPWFDVADDMGAGLEIDGMGVTIADLDGDEFLDAYVSDLGDNEVLMGGPDGFEPAGATGAERVRPPGAPESVISSSWASGATDINLDGRLDLVVANGGFPEGGVPNKIPDTSVVVADPPAVLLGIGDGRFVDVWPQLGLTWSGPARGMTIADLDGDGDEDFVIVTMTGEVRAFRNDVESPSITLVPAPGCDPAGAVLTIESGSTTLQRLLAPNTFASSHGAGAVVGIAGDDLTATVGWGDGTTTTREIRSSPDRQRTTLDCRG